jgi:predicted O-methyltransferase YrrM
MPDILADATEAYLEAMQPPADDVVREMEAQAAEERIPIADRSVATLQAILARATDADRALEFGTAIGYSTLHVARTGTEVVTLETDPERIADAEDYLERAGVRDRVDIVRGPALETLDAVSAPFDLVFVDAVKEEYEEYLTRSLPMLREGGLVVADNLLWNGNVPADDADVQEGREESTAVLRSFNGAFVGHDRLQAIITPQGDGTGIGVKTA